MLKTLYAEQKKRHRFIEPLQYSCLENPKDRGAWWVTVHGVAQSQTQPKRLSTHDHRSLLDIFFLTVHPPMIF